MKVAEIDRRSVPSEARLSVWHSGDGWAVRRLDRLQPAGAAVRGSLIFAGGRGDFIEKHLEPYAHWHARGWNVTSFDWRGQGDSRGGIKGGHLDSFDPLVADGAALLKDWIGERPGPHVAIGHSMGGHLLLRILAEHRPPLDAAVLVAPMIGINSGLMPPAMGHWVAQSMAGLGWSKVPVWRQATGGSRSGGFRQSILTSCDSRYADELWWFERQPGYSLGAPSWGWLAAAYRSIAGLNAAKLGEIDLPILLVGTDRDRLVSPAAIRRAAARLPRSELLMFPDAGHEILRESDPVRLAALARIDAFFEGHASP